MFHFFIDDDKDVCICCFENLILTSSSFTFDSVNSDLA